MGGDAVAWREYCGLLMGRDSTPAPAAVTLATARRLEDAGIRLKKAVPGPIAGSGGQKALPRRFRPFPAAPCLSYGS